MRLLALILLAGLLPAAWPTATHPPSLDYPDDIILRAERIKVPYGRSQYLDPQKHLSIAVKPGDFCTVMVLPTPFDDVFGSLNRKNFPCEYAPLSVEYSHRGARSPTLDYVNLQVRYDSPTNTYIIPLRLTVEVIFIQRAVITSNMYLTVSEMMGTSQAVDNKTVGFTYDPEVDSCQIATLSGAAGLPRYGHLLNDPSKGAMISCEEFMAAGVRYKHDAKTNSPNRDEIPMKVELTNLAAGEYQEEYFQVCCFLSKKF